MSKPAIFYKDAKSPCPKCGQRRFIICGISRPKMFHMKKCSIKITRRQNEMRADAGLPLLAIPTRKVAES